MAKKTTKTKKTRKTYTKDQWFYKVRGSYLPRTHQGWLLYIPYTFALVDGFLWAHQSGVLLYDQILRIVLVWVVAGETMTLIAIKKS